MSDEAYDDGRDELQSAAQVESGWSADWSRIIFGALTVVLASVAVVAVFYFYGRTDHKRVGPLAPRIMGH